MSSLIFSSGGHVVEPDLCFVLMPFDPEFSSIFDEIKAVVHDYAGLRCLRADDLHTPNRITDDIWNYIQRARFTIADVTGSNANVFYEIGICHAINKSVILLLQDGNKPPFDIDHIRYLRYSKTDLPELRKRLTKSVSACLDTMPTNWSKEIKQSEPDVRITSVEAPNSTAFGKPINITITAKNFGADAPQAYFSISLPSCSTAPSLASDLRTKKGSKGEPWKSGQVILKYPIGEAFIYNPPRSTEPTWMRGKSHYLVATFIPERSGLLQFYVSASAKPDEGIFKTDPKDAEFLDQRDEPVYCGVIDVHEL
jgi:hypothetical protein